MHARIQAVDVTRLNSIVGGDMSLVGTAVHALQNATLRTYPSSGQVSISFQLVR